MGRLAKSQAEKELTGAGRRKIAKAKVTAGTSAALAMPHWMSRQDAKAVWRRIIPELQRFNVLNEAFRDALGRYCVHMADWVKLSREITRDGTTMMVKMTNSEEKMPRLNPAIRVRDTIESKLIDLEDRFGISPLARYRIIAHQAANPQRDLFNTMPSASEEKPEPHAPPVPAGKDTPVGMLN